MNTVIVVPCPQRQQPSQETPQPVQSLLGRALRQCCGSGLEDETGTAPRGAQELGEDVGEPSALTGPHPVQADQHPRTRFADRIGGTLANHEVGAGPVRGVPVRSEVVSRQGDIENGASRSAPEGRG